MGRRSIRGLLLFVAGAVIAAGLYAGFSVYQGLWADEATSAGHPTLDPELFTGRVREAYKVARDNPVLLAQLHCYCGCDKEEGHKNLLDCFRGRHGGRCEICVSEVLQANRMSRQGATVERIRDALRARYYHQG